MKKDDNQPETQPSSPPTRPPKPPIVAAGIDDLGGNNSTKADYGCHAALWALSKRYRESDIHGAHSALIEEENLLRDHIGFPGYKFQLGMTMARRSDVEFHLGNAQTASSTMAEALSILADAFHVPRERMMNSRHPIFSSEGILKLIRDLDAERNIKWRQSDHAA